MRPHAGHPHTSHQNTHTHITATSHKVKSFSRVQKPSETPQICMNLQTGVRRWGGRGNFLLRNGDLQRGRSCARLSLGGACVDYPSSPWPHMPSVTQPPRRNPKRGRLVCGRNPWPLGSRSSTWHPFAAGAWVGGVGCAMGGFGLVWPRRKVKWRSRHQLGANLPTRSQPLW